MSAAPRQAAPEPPTPIAVGVYHQRAGHVCQVTTVCPPDEHHDLDTVRHVDLFTRDQLIAYGEAMGLTGRAAAILARDAKDAGRKTVRVTDLTDALADPARVVMKR